MKDFLLKIYKNAAVRKAFFALLLAIAAAAGVNLGSGCAALKPALPGPERALCYANADQVAQARVDAECADVAFPECPAHDSIMAQLKADQEACK
jgi:hypothetical protein